MANTLPVNSSISVVNIPILQKIIQAYKLWHNALPHIPRLTRYSLGEKINDLFIELSELVLTASYTSKDLKGPVIQRASVRLDTLKFFLQIGWELKAFDNKTFTELSQPLVEVGKMLGGWQKQVITTQTPRGS
jgi:nitrogen fixation protein